MTIIEFAGEQYSSQDVWFVYRDEQSRRAGKRIGIVYDEYGRDHADIRFLGVLDSDRTEPPCNPVYSPSVEDAANALVRAVS